MVNEMIAKKTNVENGLVEEAGLTNLSNQDAANALPGKEEEPPEKHPEIEPEKLPHEDPGIQPDTKPKKEDDDDDDDDDYVPYVEPEIGDDPEKEKVKIPIM